MGVDLELRIEDVGAKVFVAPLPKVEADPTQIRQLFQNVISNSLKFFRSGVQPQIQISGQITQIDGREHAIVQVKDNGIGIEEIYQQRIFEVFERLHTRSEYEGTGVGLAICRKIVERHQGRIQVESVPNEFTMFIITLPVKQVN